MISDDQLSELIESGKKYRGDPKQDVFPVVLLKLPASPPSSWMLCYVDPDNHDKAFGLMQVAGGQPELGFVSLEELKSLKGYQDKGVYQDTLFDGADRLEINRYARVARSLGQITLQFTEKLNKDDLF